jgi:hypothetical protein
MLFSAAAQPYLKALAEDPHKPKGLFRMVAAAMNYSPC